MKVETYRGKDGKPIVRVRFYERDTNFKKEGQEGEYSWVPTLNEVKELLDHIWFYVMKLD